MSTEPRSRRVPDIRWGRARQVAADPLRRLVLRLQKRDGPRVLAVTVPKSGTHLLTRVLDAMPPLTAYRYGVHAPPDTADHGAGIRRMLGQMPPGTYLATHMGHSDQRWDAVADLRVRVVVLVRDPRDLVCSMVRFAVSTPYLPEHPVYTALPSHDARLRFAITGDPANGHPPHLLHRLRSAGRWADAGALLLRYEDLVGPRGGGTVDAQHHAVRRLAQHLGLPAGDAAVAGVAAAAYDTGARTFSRGQAGGWRDELDDAHLRLLAETVGPQASALGYDLGASDQAGGGA